MHTYIRIAANTAATKSSFITACVIQTKVSNLKRYSLKLIYICIYMYLYVCMHTCIQRYNIT